jgi:hypothetical protein
MKWQGGKNTLKTIELDFETLEEAKAFADRHQLSYSITPAKTRIRRPKSYADNFA